jgi:hypothetical protein
MARAIVNKADLPPYAQAYVQRIEEFGFTWRFFPDHKLGDITNRVQVRDTAQLAPPKEVSKYAQAMKRGDQFPPVVLTADGVMVDGNTRTEAANKVGWRTFPAFEVDVVFSKAPDSVKRQLVYLGAGFNLTHGRGMNTANLTNIVESLALDDDTPQELARRLHIPNATANTMLNAAKARKRAERLNIKLNKNLTNSHLKMFGAKSQLYTDPVYAQFILLTQDARLSISATTDLAKRLALAGTENERLNVLAEERRGYQDVIVGGATSPSRAAQLRRSLGFLIGQEDADTLAELSPDASESHVKTLVAAAQRLNEVIEAQQRVEQSRLHRGE